MRSSLRSVALGCDRASMVLEFVQDFLERSKERKQVHAKMLALHAEAFHRPRGFDVLEIAGRKFVDRRA